MAGVEGYLNWMLQSHSGQECDGIASPSIHSVNTLFGKHRCMTCPFHVLFLNEQLHRFCNSKYSF